MKGKVEGILMRWTVGKSVHCGWGGGPARGACGEDEVETVDKTTDGTRASRAALCHFPTVGLLFVSIAFYECGSTTFGFLSL